MRGKAVVLVACMSMASIAGCGVPAQDEPHAVDLPRSPLAAAPEDQPSPVAGEVGEVLCLVRDGRLIQAVRRVATAPSVQQQLEELVAGPTSAEQSLGLTTALAHLSLSARPSSGPGIAVEVTEPDEGNARSDEILAYGQIVCTLTARADVNTVIFTEEGQRLEVPRADGTLTSEPLRGSDYSSLIGPG